VNVSKLVAEFGPQLLQQHIAATKSAGGDTAFLEEHGMAIVNAVSDALLDKETTQEDRGRAKFIAHIAAELLRGWPGEPGLHVGDAVDAAANILALAEQAAINRPSRA
jgi:hypothetical protein